MQSQLPPTAAFHRIKRLRVIGGFLDGTDIEFCDGLNCLIGPRGAGKSTILELIRYALDVMPGRDGDPLRKRIDGVITHNLDGGRVELEVETKDSMVYKIIRAAEEEPIVLDANESAVSLKSSRLIPADVYSQNQMESIAEKPHYQLDLLDKFASWELFEIEGEIEGVTQAIRSNTSQLLPRLQQRDRLAEQIKEKAVVEEKLKTFAKSGGDNAEAINKAHGLKALRDREDRAFDSSCEAVKSIAMKLKGVTGMLASEVPPIFSQEMLGGPNARFMDDAQKTLQVAAADVDRILEEAVDRLRAAHETLRKLRGGLETDHSAQEIEFKKLIEKYKEAQSQSAERAKVEKRRNELLSMERQLIDINKQITALEEDRMQLMAKLSDQRDERFNARQGVAKRLNEHLQPAIKIEVKQFGERTEYRQLIERALANAGVKKQVVASRVSANVPPSELYDIVRRQATKELVQRCELNENQAAAIIMEMQKPENLYELEVVEMDDLPSIQLRDGDDYKDSASLSTGQKCTAILPILLFDSANPLLIDQPEDNLDNGFVFGTVVKSIRKVHGTRQLIFVTHNPNIPVLGEASRIILMHSDGRAARPRAVGDVDSCKDHIVLLLEGGKEAFQRRMERYQY
jgi:DNA repair ATPase RecN